MKGKTQGHGFYQNMEMELNVDQILVKPTIEGFIKSKASGEFFFFFFFHDPSGYPLSIMGNNESGRFEK